jgi:hypothetical protein
MNKIAMVFGLGSFVLCGSVLAQGSTPMPKADANAKKSGDGYVVEVSNTGDKLPILPDVTIRRLVGGGGKNGDVDGSFEPISLSILIPPGVQEACDLADSLTCYMIIPSMSAVYQGTDDEGNEGPVVLEKGTYCIDVKDLLTSLPLVYCPVSSFSVR